MFPKLSRYIFVLYILCLVAAGCSSHADQNALSLYQQGRALREEGCQEEAMQAFIEATHSGTDDEALLGRVYSNMANMCRQANDHETAFEVYALSAEHFQKAGDTLAFAYALNNMAWEQAALGHKDSALALIEKAVRVCPREPLLEKVRETQAAACLFAKEYDSVLVYTTPPANEYLLTLRAQAFSYLQMDDSATYYALLLLPQTTNLFALDDLYYILTHNYPCAFLRTCRRAKSHQRAAWRTGQGGGNLATRIKPAKAFFAMDCGTYLRIGNRFVRMGSYYTKEGKAVTIREIGVRAGSPI